MPKKEGDEIVLTSPALEFLLNLHRKFEPRRQALLAERKKNVKLVWTLDQDTPHFLNETSKVSNEE